MDLGLASGAGPFLFPQQPPHMPNEQNTLHITVDDGSDRRRIDHIGRRSCREQRKPEWSNGNVAYAVIVAFVCGGKSVAARQERLIFIVVENFTR